MSTPTLKLNPFQEDALRISKQKWKEGLKRQLIWLPTGTGKTVIFANLPRYHPIEKRMLVLVHRKELALQAAAEFRKWNKDSGLKVGIEMGDSESTLGQKVVIASVQSLERRLYRFPPSGFDVIVCDEAHHSAAPTYLRVFDHFGLRDPNSKKLLLGVTATAFRSDNKKLVPAVYQDIIYTKDILQAIEEGWLCDLRSFRIEKTGADLDNVTLRTGDFAEDQLERAIDSPIRNGLIAKEWKKLAGNRRTIVFAVTVKRAQNLAAAFRDFGVTAKTVWGEDPERDAKISDHKAGALQVLCNCAVLTEGYDDWRIECIVMARPTLSRGLFVQMIGRGTRIEKGLANLVEARRKGIPISKSECLIVDVVDNTRKHDLVTLPTLFNSRIDFHGKSLMEVRKQAKPGEISNPYLNFKELQLLERAKVDVKEVDLFKGATRKGSRDLYEGRRAQAIARVKDKMADSTSSWIIDGCILSITPYAIDVYRGRQKLRVRDGERAVRRLLGAFMSDGLAHSLKHRTPSEIESIFSWKLPATVKWRRLAPPGN